MRPFTLLLAVSLLAQEPRDPGLATFSSSSNLVIVNVSLKGREDLKKSDFKIFEDGKPQEIAVFEFQKLDSRPLPAVPIPPPAPLVPSDEPPPPRPSFKDRRLLVLFFDFSSMPPADQIRTQEAAAKFLATQLTTADAVAIYTFSNKLKKVLDFTDDRKTLLATVQSFRGTDSLDTTTTDVDPDDDSFQLDETEFAVFNTDRKLAALEDLAKELAEIPEKKAVVYFASGVPKTGVENQSQLAATTNAAVRASLSFYPVDARGLVASAPAGDASVASPRGSGVFSGQSQRQKRDKNADSQETLFTLANDTGGKALLDSNDLSLGIRQAQKDVESYYILGYYSSNEAKDGRFRKIKVESTALKAKLEYRPGYYADKVWAKLNDAEREKQLVDALQLGNPVTDLPMAVQLLYFRTAANRYFVPLAIKIPGSSLAPQTELDFIGSVKDLKGRTVSALRDTLKLKSELGGRSLLYDAGFSLAPGEYRVKVLARENTKGTMGTFETRLVIPNLDSGPAAPVSSLVLATQRAPFVAPKKERKLQDLHPLVADGQKLLPSVTNAFRRSQTLRAFAEVYSPSTTSLAIYRGNRKVFESAPKQSQKAVEFVLPLAKLLPGEYTAQLNVIAPTTQKFAFARERFIILPPVLKPTP
ncbi:MAG: VWA domain-containing protein [Acidobacteria bacterium]|nr:VWA domain-containing protein [Acidobacteriota bacterium]